MENVKIGDTLVYCETHDAVIIGEVTEINDSGMVHLSLSNGSVVWANPASMDIYQGAKKPSKPGKAAKSETASADNV